MKTAIFKQERKKAIRKKGQMSKLKKMDEFFENKKGKMKGFDVLSF